ncbi:hypothetical protein TrCOL_g5615 [Triparma columacea]|uniref:Uncharacterized protein n=1 Tax=Triparma columacea TaxID=722753 RepID=A0A9W7LA10_9STRA|nr:hypothetical protein TrCOL_g5615 [Triparma columacea]
MTKTWAKQNKGFGKPATQSAVKKPTTTTITPTAPGSTTKLTPDASVASNNDPSFTQLSDSERQDKILAERFGMTPSASRKDVKAAAAKKASEAPNDIMAMIPAPVQIFIDRFLKAGVAVSTVVFVLAGVAITLEAYAAATHNPLPSSLDSFIVSVVEPNFTPGLLVLLGFSVSLGVFTAAQLGSDGATYRE